MSSNTPSVPGGSALTVSAQARERDRILLDVLRGCAAMYVVLFHCLEGLTHHGAMVDEPHGSARLVIWQFGTGILGYGHYAVLVFFVLSGYVIHLRQARGPDERIGAKKWRWSGHYLWRRLTRIYPPLLSAVLITLLFDLVGSRLYPSFYSSYPHPHGLSSAIAIFIPSRAVHFGTNRPLWSIQYELLFYVLYIAVLLIIVDRLVSNMIVVAAGLTAIGLGLNFAYSFTHHPQPMLVSAVVYLPIWASGMLIADLRCRGTTLRYSGIAAALGTLIIVSCAAVADNQLNVWADYFWGLGIFLLMAVLMLRPPSSWMPGKTLRKLARTSEWSYSVYLVHFPFLILIQAAWMENVIRLPGLVLVPLVFGLGLLLGIAAWWIVERPSKWLVAHPPRFILEPRHAPVHATPVAGD